MVFVLIFDLLVFIEKCILLNSYFKVSLLFQIKLFMPQLKNIKNIVERMKNLSGYIVSYYSHWVHFKNLFRPTIWSLNISFLLSSYFVCRNWQKNHMEQKYELLQSKSFQSENIISNLVCKVLEKIVQSVGEVAEHRVHK